MGAVRGAGKTALRLFEIFTSYKTHIQQETFLRHEKGVMGDKDEKDTIPLGAGSREQAPP